MSVKLYSGGFARFFLGEWRDAAEGLEDAETREQEIEDSEEEEEATPAEVQSFFERFRDALKTELQPHAQGGLDWSEALSGAHEAVALSEVEFGALMIIAARAAVRNKRLNPIDIRRDWFDDPAVQEIQDAEADFAPVHHLVKADSWLPADFTFVVSTEVPERDVILGSLTQLELALAETDRILNTPNETTRKVSPNILENARRGQAAFLKIAAHAAAHRLPMLIDP